MPPSQPKRPAPQGPRCLVATGATDESMGGLWGLPSGKHTKTMENQHAING